MPQPTSDMPTQPHRCNIDGRANTPTLCPQLKQPGWSETNTWVSPMSSSVSATLRAPSDDADVLLRLRVEMTLPKYDPMASRCVVHEPTVRRWRLACAKATESSRSAVRRSRPISTLPPCSEQVEVTLPMGR